MPNEKIYFKNLDTIRFIAALMVFLQHALRPIIDRLPIHNTLLKYSVMLITNGAFGVSIFFCFKWLFN
jgi:peptidoglycan/LPS O-acetylase OafA/YrhL